MATKNSVFWGRRVLLCTTLALAACSSQADSEEFDDATADGLSSAKQEAAGYPAVGVLLRVQGSSETVACTATLTGRKEIITAASCVPGEAADYVFAYDRSGGKEADIKTFERVSIKYISKASTSGARLNLALLKLNTAVSNLAIGSLDSYLDTPVSGNTCTRVQMLVVDKQTVRRWIAPAIYFTPRIGSSTTSAAGGTSASWQEPGEVAKASDIGSPLICNGQVVALVDKVGEPSVFVSYADLADDSLKNWR